MQITTGTLPAVPHVIFGIFNLAIPNIIMWVLVIVIFAIAAWARLPGFIEHSSKKTGTTRMSKEIENESD